MAGFTRPNSPPVRAPHESCTAGAHRPRPFVTRRLGVLHFPDHLPDRPTRRRRHRTGHRRDPAGSGPSPPAQSAMFIRSTVLPPLLPRPDDSQVFAYFGSWGLVALTHDGKESWRHPMPPPRNRYGMATSPVLHGTNVILVLDADDLQSRVVAFSKNTGTIAADQTPQPGNGFPCSWKTLRGTGSSENQSFVNYRGTQKKVAMPFRSSGMGWHHGPYHHG